MEISSPSHGLDHLTTSSFRAIALAPTLVRQLNMIDGFGGSALIKSVVLPYYCDGCGKEHAQVLALGPDEPRTIDPNRLCPHCGEQAEFDDLPASYLAFLDSP